MHPPVAPPAKPELAEKSEKSEKPEPAAAAEVPETLSRAMIHRGFAAVKGKINDYFSRCRLAAYDARAANALNRAEKDYLDFAAKDLSIHTDEVVGLPLQRIEPRKPLNLDEALNPAWHDRIVAFRQHVLVPLLGAAHQSLHHFVAKAD